MLGLQLLPRSSVCLIGDEYITVLNDKLCNLPINSDVFDKKINNIHLLSYSQAFFIRKKILTFVSRWSN